MNRPRGNGSPFCHLATQICSELIRHLFCLGIRAPLWHVILSADVGSLEYNRFKVRLFISVSNLERNRDGVEFNEHTNG